MNELFHQVEMNLFATQQYLVTFRSRGEHLEMVVLQSKVDLAYF